MPIKSGPVELNVRNVWDCHLLAIGAWVDAWYQVRNCYWGPVLHIPTIQSLSIPSWFVVLLSFLSFSKLIGIMVLNIASLSS